jgi:hypothetical protein
VLGLFALITGTSPLRAFHELFLPPLDIDMPGQDPFASRTLLNPIQTHLETPISTSSSEDSFSSAGLGARDDTVIPSDNDARARTLVLCFDGTGDQFNMDVRAYRLSSSSHVLPADQVLSRIPIS